MHPVILPQSGHNNFDINQQLFGIPAEMNSPHAKMQIARQGKISAVLTNHTRRSKPFLE